MQELNIPGFEAQKISVQIANGFGTSRLFVNDQLAPPTKKRGQFALRNDAGAEATAYFKGGFPDPVPALVVGDQTIRLAEALAWYQWVWAGFPLVLLFLGGAIGGFLGAIGTIINAKILRSERHTAIKYILSGFVSVALISCWIFLVLLIKLRH